MKEQNKEGQKERKWQEMQNDEKGKKIRRKNDI